MDTREVITACGGDPRELRNDTKRIIPHTTSSDVILMMMSHEPIKTGPAPGMARVQAEEARVLPAAATDPKSVKVQKSTGQGMEIEWKDAHRSHYSFVWLRDACPCATCNEEREGSGRKIGEPPKPKPGTLPMYKEPARPLEIAPVGKYAINFHWNDGHSSGIYSWEFLRRECPCAECRK